VNGLPRVGTSPKTSSQTADAASVLPREAFFPYPSLHMVATWHQSFNPQRFLARIDLEKLISRNQAYPENEVASIVSPCILCGQRQGAGVVLNDKRFVCKGCFQLLSLIEYPERYESVRRDYLVKKEAWRTARSSLIEASISRKIANMFTSLAGLSLLLIFWKVILIIVPIACYAVSKIRKPAQ
jgi:hypothetical protein